MEAAMWLQLKTFGNWPEFLLISWSGNRDDHQLGLKSFRPRANSKGFRFCYVGGQQICYRFYSFFCSFSQNTWSNYMMKTCTKNCKAKFFQESPFFHTLIFFYPSIYLKYGFYKKSLRKDAPLTSTTSDQLNTFSSIFFQISTQTLVGQKWTKTC